MPVEVEGSGEDGVFFRPATTCGLVGVRSQGSSFLIFFLGVGLYVALSELRLLGIDGTYGSFTFCSVKKKRYISHRILFISNALLQKKHKFNGPFHFS